MAARNWTKLGIVAGGGNLPIRLADHCAAHAIPHLISGIEPFIDRELAARPGSHGFGVGAVGKRYSALKAAGCDAVVIAGIVPRPDFSAIDLDFRGAMMLPKVLAAARKGDDALLRVLVEEFEQEGFIIVGADEVLGELLASEGPVGRFRPDEAAYRDLEIAAKVAAHLGALDIGQGVVVCDGLVLAVEAAEGTDAMLERVVGLPEPIRGTASARRGLLLKRPKPQQERRIDLPTIGIRTVEGAARAGLAGIAFEAEGALIIDRKAVADAADAAGIFVFGFSRNLGIEG